MDDIGDFRCQFGDKSERESFKSASSVLGSISPKATKIQGPKAETKLKPPTNELSARGAQIID